jgi:beta-lactam-binding protein with PASTA domain
MKIEQRKFILYNILAALVIFVLVLSLVNWLIAGYTDHGESLTIPSVKGKNLIQAGKMIEELDLQWQIQDSSFHQDLAPGAVIDQNPEPGTQVKKGRLVYLVVNASQPPKTEVPDLAGKSSLKQAQLLLRSYGFKVGETIYRPDPHLNAVLSLQHGGRTISPKTKLPKGSVIDLVAGDGLGGGMMALPYLIGLTLEEARFKLRANNLNIGAVVVDEDVTDTLSAIVYRQLPVFQPGNTVNTGEPIDLFLAPVLPAGIELHPEWYETEDSAQVQ